MPRRVEEVQGGADKLTRPNDLVAGYFHLSLSAQVKAMEPLGEALPNQEIFRRLARGRYQLMCHPTQPLTSMA
jgi:hypothetical protein